MSRAARTLPTAIAFSALLFAHPADPSGYEAGFFNPYVTSGIRNSPETVTPVLRKWYLPQTLYHLYGWKNWEYTNYARDHYQRYTDISLEGDRFYDIYGNHITRGWRVYDWSQEHPGEFGSSIFKAPEFGSWFNRLVVSSASKGQFHTSLTIGETIRTTLTPMTFSKPIFDGVQWDIRSDKYAMTTLASRISSPHTVAISREDLPASRTIFTNVLGLRGTAQVGDFLTMGATYVNAGHWSTSIDMADNSLKGTLGGRLIAGNVRRLQVRLSDDSPEDGTGGALLFRERIFIDGVEHREIRPLVGGGVRRQGRLEASGGNQVVLTYNIERDFVPGVADEISDYKEIRRIDLELVLANDYRVEVTSDMQTNNSGEPVFLPVARANGNIQDGSNQQAVRFTYGIPTANEIAGLTMEVSNLGGFNLRAEYDRNRRFRRFPNQNIRYNQTLGQDEAEAFYVAGSHLAYPWFAYGEVFSMDPDYSTTMFIPDSRDVIDYENEAVYLYEFVDDNDDQDRFPDWRRRYTGGGTGQLDRRLRVADAAVFPGYDENNDLEPDFNQNDNLQPDYVEPLIRYNVDPLEFLYGTDMNNNTVIDRFENDREPDYPYKRDHRGYNVYAGVELMPGTRLMLGRTHHWLLSSNPHSRAWYAMLVSALELPRYHLKLNLFESLRSVRDDIPDDVILWTQRDFSRGGMEDFPDPMVARDALVNTAFASADLARFAPLSLSAKVKHEIYHRRAGNGAENRDLSLFALTTKADYRYPVGEGFTLWPKWKQLYLRRTPFEDSALEENWLSEILFLTTRQRLMDSLWLESGVEYEVFRNLLRRSDPVPPGYEEDFEQVVLATQLTNQSHYLGYLLVANLGGRWEQRSLNEGSRTNTVLFLEVYAGLR